MPINAPPRSASSFAVAAAFALPWLNPFAGGPSAAAQPLLFSWFCCGVLALLAPASRRAAGMLALFASALALAVVGVWFGWLARAWLPPLAAALAVAICAGIGAQPRLHQTAAVALLLAALASSAIGLCQYFGVAASLHPWMNLAPAGEAFGNLRQRNQLASLLNIGLLALLWLVASRDNAAVMGPAVVPAARWKTDLRLDRWMLPAAVLLAAGNAATASRTGLVQLLLVIALAWWWNRARGPGWIGVAAIAAFSYVVATLALPWLAGLDRAQHGGVFARLAHGDLPCASRLVLWSNVLDLIRERPWTGWGWGELDYAHYVHLYGGPRFCDILDNAHNLPLHLAVELGLPLALLICGALLWLLLAARPWCEADPIRQLAWGILAVVGLHSLLEYPLWYGPFQMATGLALGFLLCGRQNRPEASKYERNRGKTLVYRSWTAILIIAICAYTAHEYWRVSQPYRAPQARAAEFRDDPIAAVGGSPLFPDQLRFARLVTTPLTPDNAAPVNALARELLHFSPEARVIEPLIASARLLGDEAQARFHEARFKAAFPAAFARLASAPARPVARPLAAPPASAASAQPAR